MDRLAFNAAAAINEQRLTRQVAVNELANVSTPGFKRSYEGAMKAITADGPGFPTRIQPQAMAVDVIQLSPGSLMATGRALDIAMNDKAVLGVSSADGKLAFTRRGDLRVNATGLLETGSGFAVRGEGGAPITVPPGADVHIAGDGQVYAKLPGQGNAPPVLVERLLLRDAGQTQLERREDGLFQPMGSQDQDIANGVKPPTVTSSALEGSNVNAMQILIKMMDQSRSFEQQVRIIKEVKSSDESGASMMKLGG
jgi:flagellar basal-body rod protein FlgF